MTQAPHDYVFKPGCECRLVSIVIINEFPSGSGEALVLGVGTFGIARWDRVGSGAYLGNHNQGEMICGQASTVKQGESPEGLGGAGGFDCGQLWGYFMKDARAPETLLTIMDEASPFAPLMSALVE